MNLHKTMDTTRLDGRSVGSTGGQTHGSISALAVHAMCGPTPDVT